MRSVFLFEHWNVNQLGKKGDGAAGKGVSVTGHWCCHKTGTSATAASQNRIFNTSRVTYFQQYLKKQLHL
jgi:hypothetical protein